MQKTFIHRCNSLISRPIWKNTLDMVLFFLAPAVASGYFYWCVIRNLLAQEKRVGRNRALSVAFLLSWFLWVLTWIPNYAFGFLETPNIDSVEFYGANWDTLLGYLYCLKSSLQMLYSHLNIFIFLIVLQKFREYQVNFFKNIKNAVFGEKVEIKSGKTVLILIVVALVVWCLFSVTVFSILTSNTMGHRSRGLSSVRETLLTNRKAFPKVRMSHSDVTIKDHTSNFRHVCADQRGHLDYRYRRCYFALKFDKPGLNFTEQVSQCRTRGGILSYPRSVDESNFIWNILEKHKIQDPFKEFIFVGFESKGKGGFHPGFTSLDGKLTISSGTHEMMFYRHRGFFFIFTGPSMCLTDLALLSQCLPRDLSTRCVCSIDFGKTSMERSVNGT